MSLPNAFADRYHTMNPATEDLLFNGLMLREGMVVLVGSSAEREDWTAGEILVGDIARLSRLEEKNMWCRVLHIESDFGKNTVSFIGEYNGGVKRKRTYSVSVPWLVKLDSLPAAEEEKEDEEMVTVTQLGTGMKATVPASEFEVNKIAEFGHGSFPPVKDIRGFVDANWEKAENEATPQANTLSDDFESNVMILPEDLFERLGEAIREIVPGLEFKESGAFWVLEVAVEEVEEKDPSKMTTTEWGEDSRSQASPEDLEQLRREARRELERQNVVFEDRNEQGPLVRAMLLEERTVNEVTRTYGPAPRD